MIQELRSRFQVERFRDNGKERGKNKFVSFTFCVDGLSARSKKIDSLAGQKMETKFGLRSSVVLLFCWIM